MKHLQRICALCFALMIMLGCLTTGTALAAGGTEVNIRLVLNDYTSYASCSVMLEKYDSMTSKEAIDTQKVSIGRTDFWERKVSLEPGFYEIVHVSVLGAWSATEVGSTERFEVKGNKMTVYVAVDNDEKPAELPPQWLVYGEDNQKFHLWDGTPDFIVGNDVTGVPNDPTEPQNPDVTLPGEDLPDDPDTGTEEGTGPNHGTAPDVPTLPPDDGPTEEPVKQSVKIGNYLFYGIAGLCMVVCLILLRKVQKERGA